MTDPIADMLVRLKNAGRTRRETALMPYSAFKERILEVLLTHGFVAGFSRRGRREKRRLEVRLAYDAAGLPAMHGCRRISRPGRRLYAAANDVRAPKVGQGFTVLSTPQGVFTHREARLKRVGGEVLFEIW